MADYVLNDVNEEEESSSFNLRSIITLIYLNWYWILLSAIVCYAGAKLYLRYTPPTYSADMKVFIKEQGTTKRSSSVATLEELGVISTTSGFGNEMEILASTAIAARTVQTLKLYTSYRMEGRVIDQELYKNSPIIVDLAESNLRDLQTRINLVVTRKNSGIHVEGNIGGANPFTHDVKDLPATVPTAVGPLIFQRNAGYKMPSDRKLFVTIDPVINAGRRYAGKVVVSGAHDNISVATVRMVDTQMERALDYLGEILNSYNDDANDDKNAVAEKTRQFIDDRIAVIRRGLDSTEANLESYMSSLTWPTMQHQPSPEVRVTKRSR